MVDLPDLDLDGIGDGLGEAAEAGGEILGELGGGVIDAVGDGVNALVDAVTGIDAAGDVAEYVVENALGGTSGSPSVPLPDVGSALDVVGDAVVGGIDAVGYEPERREKRRRHPIRRRAVGCITIAALAVASYFILDWAYGAWKKKQHKQHLANIGRVYDAALDGERTCTLDAKVGESDLYTLTAATEDEKKVLRMGWFVEEHYQDEDESIISAAWDRAWSNKTQVSRVLHDVGADGLGANDVLETIRKDDDAEEARSERVPWKDVPGERRAQVTQAYRAVIRYAVDN